MGLRLKRQKVAKNQEEPLKKYSVLLSDMLGSGKQHMSRDLGSIQQESTQILILAGSGIRGLDDTDLIYSWKDAWMGSRE